MMFEFGGLWDPFGWFSAKLSHQAMDCYCGGSMGGKWLILKWAIHLGSEHHHANGKKN